MIHSRITNLWTMIERYGELAALAVGGLADLQCEIEDWKARHPDERDIVATDALLLNAKIVIGRVRQAAEACELIEDIRDDLDDYGLFISIRPPVDELRTRTKMMRKRVMGLFRRDYLFHIPSSDVELYGQIVPFGRSVGDGFPGAQSDLEHAGNCLALHEYTAAVFHLMRAMEMMVQGLTNRLGISNPERAWGILLSDMGAAIKDFRGEEHRAWSEAHALLYHVKEAWRNNTMHPNASYEREDAHKIYKAVDAFARKLVALL